MDNDDDGNDGNNVKRLKNNESAVSIVQESSGPSCLKRALSLPCEGSTLVATSLIATFTHGWYVADDSHSNPENILFDEFVYPEGTRELLFETVNADLTSISRSEVVEMLKSEFKSFVDYTLFNPETNINENDLNKQIEEWQYQTVLKLAELIIPEIIYLIEYYLDRYKWFKEERKCGKNIDEKDYEYTFQMLSDLLKYSEEMLNHPQNFMICYLYNGGNKKIIKRHQTDSSLVTSKNSADWNQDYKITGRVPSSTLNQSSTQGKIKEGSRFKPKSTSSTTVPRVAIFSTRKKKWDAEWASDSTTQSAIENAPYLVSLDHSCAEVLNLKGEHVTNKKSIDAIKAKKRENLYSQISPEHASDISQHVRTITGMQDPGGCFDVTTASLEQQIAKLKANSDFYSKFIAQQTAINTKGGSKHKRSRKRHRNKARKTKKRGKRRTKKRYRK